MIRCTITMTSIGYLISIRTSSHSMSLVLRLSFRKGTLARIRNIIKSYKIPEKPQKNRPKPPNWMRANKKGLGTRQANKQNWKKKEKEKSTFHFKNRKCWKRKETDRTRYIKTEKPRSHCMMTKALKMKTPMHPHLVLLFSLEIPQHTPFLTWN